MAIAVSLLTDEVDPLAVLISRDQWDEDAKRLLAAIEAASPRQRWKAQTRMELVLTLRRGESVLLTFAIPVLLLGFFSIVDVLPTGASDSVDFLFPGVLALAVMSTAFVSVAIATGFDEAHQAARAAPVITEKPAVVPFDGLGPYKYLLRVPMDDRVRDRHREALRRLLDYDRARQAQLTRTLEEFLRQRGNISATAQALYVHPNTLRQRLRRIADLTRIDVKRDDWLMIEIALKLLKLEDALSRP